MNKNTLIFIAILIFIIIGLIFFTTSKNNSQVYTNIMSDLISKQEQTDLKIDKYRQSSSYTLENPKIIINPYDISPLTALIIFKTADNLAFDVYVNDEFLVKMESATEHVIPIYYLKENYDNQVKLVNGEDVYTYTLTTKKLDFDINIEIEENRAQNNKYLLSSSTSGLTYSMIDSEGNIIWHLMLNSQGMIEELSNGNFIVGVEEYITENVISNIMGIYEMNYLGKIIKRIDSKYLYHHDFQVLDDNTLLIAGSNDANHAMSIVYRLSLENGEIIDYIDFYEIFKNINPNFEDINAKLTYGFGINSVDLDPDTNDLLVSMRNLNLVMSIDYSTKEINWIYADPKYLSESFLPYLLESDTYVYGMHDAKWVNSNTISLYNNDYDIFNEQEKIVNNNNQASALILSIYGKNIYINRKFTEETKNSYAFGSYNIKNNTHLVNYSYLYKDEAIENNISIFDFQGNTYTNLVLYDEYRNTLFKAIIEDRIYQARIFNIPLSSTSYQTTNYTYINNDDEKLIIEDSNLEKAKSYPNILEFYDNYIGTNVSNDSYDELFIILKGDKNYTIKYHKTKTYYDIEPGIYDVYIKLDGDFYNLNTKIRA